MLRQTTIHLKALILVLVALPLLVGSRVPTAAIQDTCTREAVVASFAQAVAEAGIPTWLQSYEGSNCPDRIIAGARALAAVYDLMADSEVPEGTTLPGGLVIADFDNCTGANNLGGQMGAAYTPPDILNETYPPETGRGCIAQLKYEINAWSAFWMKLLGADLSPYRQLVFDIRADEPVPGEVKIELKRPGEVSITRVSGITTAWQSVTVDLSSFGYAGFGTQLTALTQIEELVFTLEADRAGRTGTVYLDNIRTE